MPIIRTGMTPWKLAGLTSNYNDMKKTLCICITVLSFTCCTTAFLEVEPTTTIPTDNFYRTEDDMTKALIAAYAPMQWLDYSYGEYHPVQFLSDIIADDYNGVGGSSENDNPYMHLIRRFQLTAEMSPIGLWNTLYAGVYRANQVIDNMDKAEGISGQARNRILAEAHTLRAFYYNWLWRFWGNIPYYTVNPDGYETDYIVPQYTADEVYAKIMEDLDFATSAGYLPEAVPRSEVGRFTRYAAYMLRSNVIMLQGDEAQYGSALNQMREIISSGIYALTPRFADIWTDGEEWNSESIFEINYSDKPSNRTWDNPYNPGGTVYPTFICPDSYKGSLLASEGYGFGPVSPALYAIYDARDSRRDGTILDFAIRKTLGESYNARLDDSGYFNMKYAGRNGGHSEYIGSEGGELNFRTNIRVWRYSETLLAAAELIVRTGGSQDEADALLNQVRARAFNTTPDELAAGLKRTATLDNLLEENRLEFACEGHRFWDLVRFGKDVEVLGERGYTASKRYLPIPQSEIDRAENTLTQNPY